MECPPTPGASAPIGNGLRLVEVMVRWGADVIACHRVRAAPKLSIGLAPTDDISLSLPEGSWDLLRWTKATGWSVRYTPNMTVQVARDGQAMSLPPAAGTVALNDDVVVTVAIGPLTLAVQVVPQSWGVAVTRPFDLIWANTLVLALFLMTSTLAWLTLQPPAVVLLEDLVRTQPATFSSLTLRPSHESARTATENVHRPSPKQAARTVRSRHAPRQNRPPELHAASVHVQTDEAVVSDRLKELFGTHPAGVAQLFGTPVGGSLEAAIGSLAGKGTAAFSGGLSLRGRGPGEDEGSRQTVASGIIMGLRSESATCDDDCEASIGLLGTKRDYDVTLSAGDGVVCGRLASEKAPCALDRELIRRIVREHVAQVRYCYERELGHTPGLAGKVTMQWVIADTGVVTQAGVAETQLHNSAVEDCLARQIKTWRFPMPKNSGAAQVNYPFVFRQTGS